MGRAKRGRNREDKKVVEIKELKVRGGNFGCLGLEKNCSIPPNFSDSVSPGGLFYFKDRSV
jgi:hypothetical protein